MSHRTPQQSEGPPGGGAPAQAGRASGRGRCRTGRGNRGVALILAVTTVAVLTAFSVEFSYNMRVSVYQSANLRREVQAYYHARSAMEIARAVIYAETEVQQMLRAVTGGRMNIELWRYACLFANIFATGQVDFLGKTLFELHDQEGLGIAEGGFGCEIFPEDGKINVTRVANQAEKTSLFRMLYAVMRRYFGVESMEQRDREAVELILNIIDWVDPSDVRSDIDDAGNVVDAGGSVNSLYRRYGYQARNAKPDTNEELRLIEGMTDQIFCDIGANLTVYDTEKLNINAADIEVLKALICEYIEGDMLAACSVTGAGVTGTMGELAGLGLAIGQGAPIDYVGALIETCRQIREAFFMPGFASPQRFTQFLTRLPAPLNTLVRVNTQQLQGEISTRGRILRIRTTGHVGRLHKTLEAVVDTSGGQYLYWSER